MSSNALMKRRGSRSPLIAMQSSPVHLMSSSAVQSNRSEEAPFGLCPFCRLPIFKCKSNTLMNPDRWFYKCPNYQKNSRCRFYMWEEDFERFVDGARGVTVQPDFRHGASGVTVPPDVVPSLDSDPISRIESDSML